MAKQRITVELDDETIRALAALGKPIEVLARLAVSAADSVRHPGNPRRELTDQSLQVERHQTDTTIAGMSDAADEAAECLTDARDATNTDLAGERTHAESVLGDLREANAQMVSSTIRAHELTDDADKAKERAETSRRELVAVAEFREMFIGILGHDLRTPLASIVMSAARLLQRGQLDEQDAITAARIIRSSQRITRMITQLLDLTRARLGGGLPIEPAPADLREVCRSVVEEFEAPIELEVEGDLTGIWDQDRLTEVLSNLAGNAVTYATPGTVVFVKAHPEGAEVIVEVCNQGEPIPADVLPFIFEPFRRSRQHEKSATGNLGLGLYIADQIVRAHGGTLEARSADGTTTFAIRLPRGTLPVPTTPGG